MYCIDCSVELPNIAVANYCRKCQAPQAVVLGHCDHIYCMKCSFMLPEIAKFCSKCQTSQPPDLIESSAVQEQHSKAQVPVQTFGTIQQKTPQPPPAENTVLLDLSGQPKPAFDRLVGSLFHALDRTFKVSLLILTRLTYILTIPLLL
jgi:ribosomal protein L40E